MAEKISLSTTSTQRYYLLALRNNKVLCPVCGKTSAIFSRQGLNLHYKTMHKNNVFSEEVLVEGDALVRQCASEETLSNIMTLSERRREEVSRHWLLIST